MNRKSRFFLARIRKDLSQIEVAERAGITQGTVSKIENNNIHPSPEIMRNLANILNVDMAFLFPEYDE